MEIKEIFKEFMMLGWDKNLVLPIELKDIKLSNYSIARLSKEGICIYNLTNGSRFQIPFQWLSLFIQFNTHSGYQVLLAKEEDIEKDDISKVIYYLLKLVLTCFRESSDEILDLVNKIKNTEEFREWLDTTFNYTIPPIEFINLINTKLI